MEKLSSLKIKNTFKTGENMYLAGIGFLAIISILSKDFVLTRPRPLPEALAGINPSMAYISSIVLMVSVLAVFFNRYRFVAILVIANLIFWLATSRHIINLWRDYINGFKSTVLISGALLILTQNLEKD